MISSSPQINHANDTTDQVLEGSKKNKQKVSQPNTRSESYKESSPKRSRSNRPKSDPSLYE